MVSKLAEGARAREDQSEGRHELAGKIDRVLLVSLEFLLGRAEQVHPKDQLQDQHAKSIYICITAAIDDGIRDADKVLFALEPFFNREALQLYVELVPPQRVNLCETSASIVPCQLAKVIDFTADIEE